MAHDEVLTAIANNMEDMRIAREPEPLTALTPAESR